MYDILALLGKCNEHEGIYFLVLDFVDAFFRMPLNPDERHFFVINFAGRFLRWNRVAQGSTNGPQSFCRLAALVGRLTQSVFDSDVARLQVYIDDPILTMRGTEKQAKHNMTKAILVWRCCCLDLAFSHRSSRKSCHVGGPRRDSEEE